MDETDEVVDISDFGFVNFEFRIDVVEEAVLGFNLVLLKVVEFTVDFILEVGTVVVEVDLTFFGIEEDF